MSKYCEICNKGYLKSNLVPRGIGDRVTKRTLSRQQANIRNKRLELNGVMVRVKICTSCLKRLKKDAAPAKAAKATA